MIAHADDQTVGGLEGSVSKMLQADPDFRKNFFFYVLKYCFCFLSPIILFQKMSIPPPYFLEDIFSTNLPPLQLFVLVLSWQEFVSGYVMYPDEKNKYTCSWGSCRRPPQKFENVVVTRAGRLQG